MRRAMRWWMAMVAAAVAGGHGAARGVEPATRPAATRPVVQPPAVQAAPVPAAKARIAIGGAVNVRATERARRESQRQHIMGLPDGGTFRFDQLIRFDIADGRLRSELVPEVPAGQARRVKVEGSSAVWMINAFSNGQQGYHSLVRYDFDAPDDEFWMISYTFQQGSGITTFYAQGGEACEAARLQFTQRPATVTVNISGWNQNAIRPMLVASASNLFEMRGNYPEAVRKYLLPALRKLTNQAILRPAAGDVYRVFTDVPADPKMTLRLLGLLPGLSSDVPDARERATAELMALGPAGALAALRMDADLLLPEQANRLAELVAAHCRMTLEDPSEALRDQNFLIDCLEDDDRAVRAQAREALQKLLARKLEFDVDAAAPEREAAADRLRAALAKEQGKDKFPDPNVPRPAPRAMPVRG